MVADRPEPNEGPEHKRVPALAVFTAFLKLGLTSFGGPIAHLGHFQRDLVERRRWFSAADYAELVALAQFLPGPASSQTGFAIGLRLAGLPGALAAFLGFTLPSAALMIAAAFALDHIAPSLLTPVVHGLKLVAVTVVAHVVLTMALAHCRRLALAVLALSTAAVLLVSTHPAATPAAIFLAAIIGAVIAPAPTGPPPPTSNTGRPASLVLSVALALVFATLLVGLPLLRLAIDDPALVTADIFYRAGALVFGGGHVILPLLQNETAAMVADDAFLAGYGAAQALPGPLFTFAGYLGALTGPSGPSLGMGLLATAMIFLPGFLLISAGIALWGRIRSNRRATGAILYTNAAVVGVLAAALINPIATAALLDPHDGIIAAAGFALLLSRRVPVLAVVAIVATAGALGHVYL